MYQVNLSVNAKNSNWFFDAEKALTIRLKSFSAVLAHKEVAGRLFVTVACDGEHKSAVRPLLEDALTDIYLSTVKYEYLSERLNLSVLDGYAYGALLHTLVAFDRECEQKIIAGVMRLNSEFALDGFFNFRLTELRGRWDEVSALATANSPYLASDDTLNELLRFLLSAVTPKIASLSVTADGENYGVFGKYKNSDFELKLFRPEQLLAYIINVAPLELTLIGDFNDKKLYNRLINLFDTKKAV